LSKVYVLQSLWGVALDRGNTLLAYFLGKVIPVAQIDKYLLPINLGIIVISLVLSIIHLIQENRSDKP
jgi:membrane-associated protein